MDTAEKLKKIMSRVLRIEEKRITENSSRNNISSWDSLNHVNLILAIEGEFGISLTAKEVSEANSVAKIRTFLTRRGLR